MPKPIPKNASPVFHVRGHHLDSEAVDHLLTLLGYPNYDLRQEALDNQLPGFQVEKAEPGAPLILKRQKISSGTVKKMDLGAVIYSIELALGLYVYGSTHIDEIPRAADYCNIFESLRTDAVDLLAGLSNLGGYYRDQFEIKGESIYSIEQSLASLIGVCEAVKNDMTGKSSKGSRINRALILTIKELLRIFRANAILSAKDNKINFLKFALVEAKIVKPLPANKDTPSEQRDIDFTKKVARYIYQADKSTDPMPNRF